MKLFVRALLILVIAILAMLLAFQIVQMDGPWCGPANQVQVHVVDQDDLPVGGVEILVEAWEYRMVIWGLPFGPSLKVKHSLSGTTDAQGQVVFPFRISHLTLRKISKSGYLCQQRGNFSWHRYAGAYIHQASFVIYDMAPAAKAELREHSGQSTLPKDGAPVFLNFLSGKCSTSADAAADLAVSLRTIERGDGSDKVEELTIRAINGGIWITDDEVPYAPRHGYEEGILYRLRGSKLRTCTVGFYYRSGGGERYSRVGFEISEQRTKTETALLRFTYRLNPTGARFLGVPPERNPSQVRRMNSLGSDGGGFRSENRWWLSTSSGSVMYSEATARDLYKMANEANSKGNTGNANGLKEYLAKNPFTPADILVDLSNAENFHVRESLASNPNVPVEILGKLAGDSMVIVRDAVAANPTTPEELRTRLRTQH